MRVKQQTIKAFLANQTNLQPSGNDAIKTKQVENLLKLGEEKYTRKDYKGAIAAFTQALQLDPKNIAAYMYRGLIYEELRDYKSAVADYEQVSRISPTSLVFHNLINYALLKDKQKAIAVVNQRIAQISNYAARTSIYNPYVKPFQTYHYSVRGTILIYFQDYTDAIKDYSQALQFNPNYTPAYYARGFAYDRLGKRTAIKDYQQVLAINPQEIQPKEFRGWSRSSDATDLAIPYYFRGMARAQLNDLQGAITDLDQAIQLDPNYLLAYRARGLVRDRLQDKQGAIQDLQKATQFQHGLKLIGFNSVLDYTLQKFDRH